MNFKKFDSLAPGIPTIATDGAAGYDLRTYCAWTMYPGERRLFRTGWGVEIPTGYVGIIKGRSGLSHKNGIQVLGGVIDSDYRGEIGVILLNTSDTEVTFVHGDRIAQMVVLPCLMEASTEVEEWSRTDRNDAGFGSTGA